MPMQPSAISSLAHPPNHALARSPNQPCPRPQMDIRIGVVTHTLVAKKLKQDQFTKAEAALPKNNHITKDESYLDDDLED